MTGNDQVVLTLSLCLRAMASVPIQISIVFWAQPNARVEGVGLEKEKGLNTTL